MEGHPLKRLFCGPKEMLVILDNKYLLNGSYVFLDDNPCYYGPIKVTDSFTKISTKYTECGTTETQSADQIMYKNKVFYQEKTNPNQLYAIVVKCHIKRKKDIMGTFPLKFIKEPKVKFTKSKYLNMLFHTL